MDASRKLLWIALPVFLLAALAEAVYLRAGRGVPYDWREAGASLAIALGQRLIAAASGGAVLGLLSLAWTMRIWTIPMDGAWNYGLLFIATEFTYYWQHRCSHEIRWLWATHAVHHSPQHLALANADRLGWTGQVSGNLLFFVPLVLVGFAPPYVAGAIALNLTFQFWLHTEIVGRLGWFDRIFNSPSNHRVHHAVNARYLDRNYGGVLMIFDHLFRSYQPEHAHDPCRYGLVGRKTSYNPLGIVFGEWLAVGRELRTTDSFKAAVQVLFGPPGGRQAAPQEASSRNPSLERQSK